MLFVTTLFTRVFRWHVPSYIFLLTVSVLLFFIVLNRSAHTINDLKSDNGETLAVNSVPAVNYLRLKNHELTGPLLMTFCSEEPSEMSPLKEKLSKIISNDVGLGKIGAASVFLRKMNSAGSISINSQEYYNPGSMMKIPVMITCLKEGMEDPSFLNKKILFANHNKSLLSEDGALQILKPGTFYSVRELIEYMIIDSDNDAMGLLYNQLGQTKLDKIFTDLDIKIPASGSPSFDMNPFIFSRFLTVLYNATYLDAKNSEWALSTMCKAKYDKSITRNLPKQLRVAHKYGVASVDSTRILSESAIVYCANVPYILVIMTKGHDYNSQSDVISNLSDIVFSSLNN